MVEKETVIQDIAIQLGIPPVHQQELFRHLVETVTDWLEHDFNRLIQVLYRMDVNETKLKRLLKDNPTRDAATIIVELMIERHVQKMEARKGFTGDAEWKE